MLNSAQNVSGYVEEFPPGSLLDGQQHHGLFLTSLGEGSFFSFAKNNSWCCSFCWLLLNHAYCCSTYHKEKMKSQNQAIFFSGPGYLSQNQSSRAQCRGLHFTANKYYRFSWQEWNGKGPNAEQKSYSEFAVLLHHWFAMWSLAISLILSVKRGKPEPMSPKTNQQQMFNRGVSEEKLCRLHQHHCQCLTINQYALLFTSRHISVVANSSDITYLIKNPNLGPAQCWEDCCWKVGL